VELRRRDIGLPERRPASVTTRGTHSVVPERFLAPGESRRRPLKGRGTRASRTIPLPAELVAVVERHLTEFVERRADAYLFTTPTGKRLNMSNFQRDVWAPAKEAVFDEDDPLRRARRHDLRHAAITAWLNAGVPLKTAQAWSGHKTASVLLDTYLGVMRGDEEVALARLEAFLTASD
jgi:integrase